MTHHEHAHEAHDHSKVYLAVFGSLMVLTVVTFAVSRLDMPRAAAIAVGMAIATVKASLVAAYFMHLVSERTIVRSILGLSLVGLFFLMLLPYMDIIRTAGASTQLADVQAAHGVPAPEPSHGGSH